MIAIPEDVAAHLQAAIQPSNGRLQLRILYEAEVLAQPQPVAAVALAGAVLDSALEDVPQEFYSRHSIDIGRWGALRNEAVHSGSPQLTATEAVEMVRGIAGLIRELVPSGARDPESMPSNTPQQVRGKYRHIPTSSSAFIERKLDELGLEH